MSIIQHFIAAWRETKLSLKFNWQIDEAEGSEPWDNDVDGKNLSAFFASDTGKKLRGMLTNFSFRSCTHAVGMLDNHSYYAGIAKGVLKTVGAIERKFYDPLARSPEKTGQEQDESEPSLPVSL
jgi:hypothetical protein